MCKRPTVALCPPPPSHMPVINKQLSALTRGPTIPNFSQHSTGEKGHCTVLFWKQEGIRSYFQADMVDESLTALIISMGLNR
jgi:hypothetical protein